MGVPPATTQQADRYVFLLEIVDEAQISSVRDRFQAEVWPKVGPEGMADLIGRLRELARNTELERFHRWGADDLARIQKRLADRLFTGGLDRWPEARDALGELASASTMGSSGFFERAVAELGEHPAWRNRLQAEVLLRLVKLWVLLRRSSGSGLGAASTGFSGCTRRASCVTSLNWTGPGRCKLHVSRLFADSMDRRPHTTDAT